MSEEGEFKKFKVEVRSSMAAHEFYEKFFNVRPFGIHQKEKKIVSIWDPNLTVFQNSQSGALFFYDRPMGYGVQINLKFNSPGVFDN